MNQPLKLFLVILALSAVPASRLAAADHFVDPNIPASDAIPGTAAKPRKTLARMGMAKELKPGDVVYVKSIFRDLMTIKINGDPAKPFAFQWYAAGKYSPWSPPSRRRTLSPTLPMAIRTAWP